MAAQSQSNRMGYRFADNGCEHCRTVCCRCRAGALQRPTYCAWRADALRQLAAIRACLHHRVGVCTIWRGSLGQPIHFGAANFAGGRSTRAASVGYLEQLTATSANIDLNADLGEGCAGSELRPNAGLFRRIIACGFHAR